jgi:lambda family phage portal protein
VSRKAAKAKSKAPDKSAVARSSMADIQAAAQVVRRRISARWDAAETTDDNRKHWAMADGLSADMAASPGVRRILRNRSRYEVANNSYARGIVNTLANDCVGSGPRLQLTGLPRGVARDVERKFSAWAKAADLAEKLRTLRAARAQDGEGIAVLVNNERLRDRVRLDLKLIEAEQCASDMGLPPDPGAIDGITFDAWGNPEFYDILRHHPGGRSFAAEPSVKIPAERVLHYFVPERPGQRRGIPELTAALPLFAQLRRWTLSCIAAAETAADFAAIMRTTGSVDPEEAKTADEFERIEFERRAILTLPAGWDVTQMKAEQPTSTYGEFKREILNEIARCLSMPFNVAAGNSSGYNYSSGRLDWQIYGRAIEVDRSRMESQVLEDVFAAWRHEAVLIEGYLPQQLRTMSADWSHAWQWDGFAHIDPEAEAKAQEINLKNGTTNLAELYGRKGQDWEEQIEITARIGQRQRELATQYGSGGTSGEVQAQAMNGIQITAMTEVLAQVGTGAMAKPVAVSVLRIAFPSVDAAQIAAMVEAVEVRPVLPQSEQQPSSAA